MDKDNNSNVESISQAEKIADYVIPEENPVRERIGEVMRGQILELAFLIM